MQILTSISPKHHNADAQRIAIDSWIEHGYRPVSFNRAGEINEADYPGVLFTHTRATSRGLFKAPYVFISEFIEQANDYAIIINSDISLSGPIDHLVERSEKGLVFANRHDHNGDFKTPVIYEHGFDAFIIHRKFFDVLPRSLFCMGQTWWDYWIPYRFIMANLPIELVREPLFLHHRHPIQYDVKEWQRMTEHFVWMEGYPKGRSAQSVTNEVYKMIKRHAG